MKRVLCIRFPNWPIQCLRKLLRESGNHGTALALHTAAPSVSEDRALRLTTDEDTRFIRSLFPSSMGGPAIVAVSQEAWTRGVRPGMPLAEARSMAQPVVSVSGRRHLSQQAARPEHRKPAAKSGSGTEVPDRRPLKRPVTQPVLMPISSTEVQFHEWQPQRDRKWLKAVAELTRRYAPVVGMDDMPLPDSLLLDITGCGPLFGGESGLAESLLRDLRSAGWACRIAIAQSVSAVWALTHADGMVLKNSAGSVGSGRSRRSSPDGVLHDLPIQIIPPGMDREEVYPLPAAASRLGLSDLEILRHLGILTIGQLLGLPREDLPSRLSSSAVVRIQQLQSVIEEPIHPVPEANPVTAAWSSDDPACGMNDIQYILGQLTEQISEQLIRRRTACSSVECRFHGLDGSQIHVTAGVVKPTQSHELLHEVLCMRIEHDAARKALEAAAEEPSRNPEVDNSTSSVTFDSLVSRPFCSVRLTATVAPLPAAKQKDLFSPEEHIVPQEELATLISRLSGRLGPDAVCVVRTQADARPEFSILRSPVVHAELNSGKNLNLDNTLRRLTEPDPDSATDAASEFSSLPPRPLRLLAMPVLIPGSDLARRFPAAVMHAGRSIELIHYSSPERLQTAWWTDQPCHRDYYVAAARNGTRLWLYRDLHSGLWYLHGLFD